MTGMLIPGQNQLAEPEIVKVSRFEDLLAEFKAEVVAYVATKSPELAARLSESIENEAELITMLLEAFTLRLQGQERKYNAKIKQMLAWWAEGSNLDARLADVGLSRQMIDPGDPNAYPPVEPTYEDDDSARLRYYLAPHAPAAGSRLHYRREAMTLGNRAQVKVESPSAGVVVVTYTFGEDSIVASIKDGNGRRTAPGEVMVTMLSRDGNGSASEEMVAAARAHFARDDVRPETDKVTVQGAAIVPYRIKATVYINPGPDASLVDSEAAKKLQAYADQCHVLGGRVDTSWIDYQLHAAGAARVQVDEPSSSVICTDFQAPYCMGIDLQVLTV